MEQGKNNIREAEEMHVDQVMAVVCTAATLLAGIIIFAKRNWMHGHNTK